MRLTIQWSDSPARVTQFTFKPNKLRALLADGGDDAGWGGKVKLDQLFRSPKMTPQTPSSGKKS